MSYPDPFPVLYSEPAISGVYPLPKQNIVVLTCMDLRMKDELVSFLDRDNLTNRYDHLITAGAALGVMKHDDIPRGELHGAVASVEHECEKCPPWRTTFFDHLEIALKLHYPHDVYIVEHRNCGAYKTFLGDEGDFPNEVTDWDAERTKHHEWAKKLHDEIMHWYELWYRDHADVQVKKLKLIPAKLGVHAFLMDMRGNVELLLSTAPVPLGGGDGDGRAAPPTPPVPPASPPPPKRKRK